MHRQFSATLRIIACTRGLGCRSSRLPRARRSYGTTICSCVHVRGTAARWHSLLLVEHLLLACTWPIRPTAKCIFSPVVAYAAGPLRPACREFVRAMKSLSWRPEDVRANSGGGTHQDESQCARGGD